MPMIQIEEVPLKEQERGAYKATIKCRGMEVILYFDRVEGPYANRFLIYNKEYETAYLDIEKDILIFRIDPPRPQPFHMVRLSPSLTEQLAKRLKEIVRELWPIA